MSEKKINLEEIIKDELYNKHLFFNKTNPIQIKNICMEFGKQLLELAAENVNLIEHWENSNTKYIEDSFCNFDDDGDLLNTIYANRESILDTIKQVE